MIAGDDTVLTAGPHTVSVDIPSGKVPTGGALAVSGNNTVAVGAFGPDGAGHWQESFNVVLAGGTAHAVVFVIDGP